MEVKIKDNNGYVDADWTIEDGIMVVSPKVEFIPKDGDVVYSGGFYDFIFIYKDCLTEEAYYYVSLFLKDNRIELPDGGHIGYVSQLRPATEEEKQKLFDKLKEEGYEWDAEKKEVVKIKWKPVDREKVYVAGFTFYGMYPFCPFEDKAYSDSMQWRAVYKRGWYFKTIDECQEFCNRLNDAIDQVKP